MNSTKNPAVQWVPVAEQLPRDSNPVSGYNPLWIDADINPQGIRECFLAEDKWYWARYCIHHVDYHMEGDDERYLVECDPLLAGERMAGPTHWRLQPDTQMLPR